MKKSLFARGIMAALSLAGVTGMVGCGAETGAPEAEIGSTSQALMASTLDTLASSGAIDRGASCTVHVNDKDLVLAVTGIDTTSGSSPSSQILLMDPSAAANSQWLSPTISGSITTARNYAQMIRTPGSDTQCLLVGGSSGAIGSAAISANLTKKLDVSFSMGTYTVTVSNGPTGFTKRGSFQLAQCGASSVIAVGGDDAGPVLDIESWNTANAAWASLGTLSDARLGFALAPADEGSSPTHFIAAGGDSGSTKLKDVDMLVFGTSSTPCDSVTVTQAANVLGTETSGYPTFTHARYQVVAFDSAYTAPSGGSSAVSDFFVVGGDDGSTAYKTTDKLRVTWSATPSLSAQTYSSANDISTETRNAKIVKRDGSSEWYIIGGQNHSGTALNTVQKYASGFSNTTFTGARFDHVAEWVPGITKVVVIGGDDGSNPLGTAISITP